MTRSFSHHAWKALRFAKPVVNRVIAHRGRRHGLAAPIPRSAFVATVPTDDALEIGPFNNPTLTGPGIEYFDVLNTPALHRRATTLGFDRSRIPSVRFVSPTGDLDIVDRRFATVLSSHAVEHQPDLIAHFNAVARLLKPGGRYFLVVPDKRYCFDHHIAGSTLGDVEAAHRERRRVHTPASVRAHQLERTHNDPVLHWMGLHGRPRPDAADHAAADAEAARATAGEYIDVHAWTFSPAGFHAIVAALSARNEIALAPVTVHETAFGQLEFFAVLERTATPAERAGHA